MISRWKLRNGICCNSEFMTCLAIAQDRKRLEKERERAWKAFFRNDKIKPEETKKHDK
jgi:hypothetical protein